ncbi:MAG: TlpA disulfide reductase family protein [Leeuwenhoekiella sp.]
MKIRGFIALITVILLTACAETEKKENAMTLGNLTVSNEKPKPGDSLSVTYAPATPVEENMDVSGYYSILVNTNSYAYDLDLEAKGPSSYSGSIKVPDSATAISFAFKVDNVYDSYDKEGYGVPLYNGDGEELTSAAPSIAYYNMRYGTLYDVEMDADSALAVLKSGIDKDQKTREAFEDAYLQQAYRGDKEGMQFDVAKYIATLEDRENKTAEDFNTLSRWYTATENKTAADSIRAFIENEYPVGAMARTKMYKEFTKAKGMEEKSAAFEAYEKKVDNPGNERINMLRSLAMMALDNNEPEAAMEYLDNMNQPGREASVLNNLAWDMAENGEDLDLAEKMSRKSLALIQEEKESPSDKPDYYSPKMYKEGLDYSISRYYDTYAVILNKKGDLEGAIAAQEEAVGEGKNPEYNGRYVQFLNEAEQYKKAQEKASQFIKQNHSTSDVVAALEEAHAKNNNEQEFDTYLADLKAEGRQKAIAALKKKMIDEEAPEFALVNLDGEKIALNELEGKTVVLDFWATWCGPCIQSFPGMQKAQDNYKDNPNVVFLFIDTWESESGEERKENVSKFIADNNYSFEVLLDDPKEEGSREYEVVSDYGVSGIPTKFILGPDGRIKFKSVGYMGSTEQLAEEVALMIEMASGDDLKV